MKSPLPSPSKNFFSASTSNGANSKRIIRGRKRKHSTSESSSDTEDVLPENTLEVEKNLHASAVKNNLDDISVKKILKKVVTNDHVLALVKLREEEEEKSAESKEDNPQPKLTRAKVKELMKVSPKTAPWNLENMELTPIKHIPVKTRPEVKALIAHELHADEDDDEYEPTHDDLPSDDDHTLESCSDVDSQPRTPATPRRLASPRIVKDGPFKVPKEISTPRRKLDLDEDATIALRTRSKLSLSSIPIDHIESSFVPPDEVPMPVVDDIWNEFLQECMNPEASKPEDDDDDPEYNVAADPDAHDEDDHGLIGLKISKKELNDLVTELFNIMPETTVDDALSGKLANGATETSSTRIGSTHWEGKQELLTDDETENQSSTVIQPREKRMSIGKNEPHSDPECLDKEGEESGQSIVTPQPPAAPKPVTLSVVEGAAPAHPAAPAPLRGLLRAARVLTVTLEPRASVLPEQTLILQQQLRQHIQLAASNYLQLLVHPVHWALAPTYKEYLDTLIKMVTDKPDSVAKVCNLKSAYALMKSWEAAVSTDTPENAQMVEFVQKEVERARRRAAQNNLYVGNFHETFLNVVSNSPVFLYPHLLPPLPYRTDGNKRFSYTRSEDELIAVGIDEFWQYVEDNREMFKVPTRQSKHRWGLGLTVQLVCKHMLPWMLPRALLAHVQHVRKGNDADNPINKFFKTREVTPVKHTLLPYNPKLTLYEQNEQEMPRLWVRHLAKTSKRFRSHIYRRVGMHKIGSIPPTGVPVELGTAVTPPCKKPLPISFTKQIASNRQNVLPPVAPKQVQDKFDLEMAPKTIAQPAPAAVYSIIQTAAGAFLVPMSMVTNTVNSAATPICASEVKDTTINLPEDSNTPTGVVSHDHCQCCVLVRKICKQRQTLMTDFFTPKVKICPCKEKRRTKYPKVTKKLRLLVNSYKSLFGCAVKGLQYRVDELAKEVKKDIYDKNASKSPAVVYSLEEIADVTSFQLKLTMRTAIARNNFMKRRIHTLFTKFKPDSDDPYAMFEEMERILDTECVDVFKEFLGFLTTYQADRIGRFLDYFKQACLTDLMQRIENQVSNKHHKFSILTKLRRLLNNAKLSPCEICSGLLRSLDMYPALADHVFTLFPHRREANAVVDPPVTVTQEKEAQCTKPQEIQNTPEDSVVVEEITVDNEGQCTKPKEIQNTAEDSVVVEEITVHNRSEDGDVRVRIVDETEAIDNDVKENEAADETLQAIDYEADHSASDDDGSIDNLTIIEDPDEIDDTSAEIKKEAMPSENVIDTPDLTVTKTEVQDLSESEMSMMIMSEDELVKSEPLEWKRDEDKLLLEVVKRSLAPEEGKENNILEVIEEKKDLQFLVDSLPHKSLDDIRERILYLLQLLILNR